MKQPVEKPKYTDEKSKLKWFQDRPANENIKRANEITKKGGNIMNHDSNGVFSKIK